ncbi:pyrophosphatase PpaX [Paenibacillus sp. CN-4]|uniref:pyrophosphatase PpaX n=1 Tax=Paenibacillus nanchangensis TaxID=3348343 RepID=UPI00397C53E3
MINCILFDLDGTIVDTNELIISSFTYALQQHALPVLTREEMIPHMGTTLQHQMRVFSGLEDVSGLELSYRAFNVEHHDALVRSFPRVNETLDKLREQGIRMGVVTTKIRPTTIKALERFDLLQYMEVIVTVNDVEHPKPHPEPVQTAIRQLQADPARTLMVGDSAVDIQSAQAAGVKSAAVAWSLKGEAVLRAYHPDYVIHDMTDLLGIVAQEKSER